MLSSPLSIFNDGTMAVAAAAPRALGNAYAVLTAAIRGVPGSDTWGAVFWGKCAEPQSQ
jgi:hypothetical protein